MMHDPIRIDRLHPLGCGCEDCDPEAWRARQADVDYWATMTLAGCGFGAGLVAFLEFTGLGPRLFHALGLL